MPLRDHFQPPLSKRSSWEGFHAMWPAVIVQHLRTRLPAGFIAEPGVHSGSRVEIDISAYEAGDVPRFPGEAGEAAGDGGVAVATWAPVRPAVAIETDLPDYDEYEVRVYDAERDRRLVAAVEIVSPANKDRPDHRNAFVAKCVALLREGVAVGIVDLVTPKHFNLYQELRAFIGHPDPDPGDPPPHLYAAACRWVRRGKRTLFEAWPNALAVGAPLPTLPLWLTPDLAVPLDLEATYEQACRDLWIA